jgi:hypothetical protein
MKKIIFILVSGWFCHFSLFAQAKKDLEGYFSHSIRESRITEGNDSLYIFLAVFNFKGNNQTACKIYYQRGDSLSLIEADSGLKALTIAQVTKNKVKTSKGAMIVITPFILKKVEFILHPATETEFSATDIELYTKLLSRILQTKVRSPFMLSKPIIAFQEAPLH